MSDSLKFTGERFTPECVREIWYEHFHRYALAARWCDGLRTLDAACGEGYGSAVLAASANTVEGVDISGEVIAHARQRYGNIENLSFQEADCTSLPFADNEFDAVIFGWTLSYSSDPQKVINEIIRVSKKNTLIAVGVEYSDLSQNESEEGAVNLMK